MRIDISRVIANPFRSFDLDPIDEAQVERLVASIGSLGFFSGVTARKRSDGMFELAAGHHRWIAAQRAGLRQIEAVVGDYDDNEMRRIMAIENLTQRGANTGAQLDAVAAFAYQVAYELLTDRDIGKAFPISDHALAVSRGKVLNEGPGTRSIYAAINGFHYDEHMERKEEDEKSIMISQGDVRKAVAALKESGRMAEIVAKAYALVEEERAEDEAKAKEAERKAEAKRREEEERERAVEAERTAIAERKAKEAAEAVERAEREKATEAERKRLAEEKKQSDEFLARKRKAEADAAAARNREETERRAQAAKEAKAKAEREAEERRRIQAQKDQEKIYDIRCNDLFPDPTYAAVFRKAVTSVGAREVITREEQYKVAQDIVKRAQDWKRFSDGVRGTELINNHISELITAAREVDRKAEEDRQRWRESVSARAKVDALWSQVKRGIAGIDQALRDLVAEHGKWDAERYGEFPPPVNMIDTYGSLGRIQRMMSEMYGDAYGPQPDAEDAVIIDEPKQINGR